jgi:hypothetical protein
LSILSIRPCFFFFLFPSKELPAGRVRTILGAMQLPTAVHHGELAKTTTQPTSHAQPERQYDAALIQL